MIQINTNLVFFYSCFLFFPASLILSSHVFVPRFFPKTGYKIWMDKLVQNEY